MLRKKVLDYCFIVFLAVLLALNYILFIVSNKFAPAGINGIATMVQYKLNFSIGYFSLIINIPLGLFALKFIDKEFGIKSLVFCLAYSLSYLLLQRVDLSSFVYDAEGVDTIFPCLVAGMISGFVYGVGFRLNSSTGGTDIIAKYVSKKNPTLDFFWVTFLMNAVVAFSSYFVYGERIDGILHFNWKPVCLCVLYCFMSSFVGSQILKGSKTACKFFIITSHAEEISKEILTELKHSATKITGQGIYSGENKEILICIINKHQIVEFRNILKKYDKTFAFVETVSETIGNFKRIK